MCICEFEIVCTFECVVCNILWILGIFGRLWFINVVCDMLKSICGLHKYMLCLSNVKAKRKNKKKKKGASPSAWVAALGEDIYKKKRRFSSPSAWYKGLGEEDFF
jgi:hypothetical protein